MNPVPPGKYAFGVRIFVVIEFVEPSADPLRPGEVWVSDANDSGYILYDTRHDIAPEEGACVEMEYRAGGPNGGRFVIARKVAVN